MTFMMLCEHRTPMDMLGMGIQQDSEQAQGRQAYNYECLGRWQPKKPHYQLYKNLQLRKKGNSDPRSTKKLQNLLYLFLFKL